MTTRTHADIRSTDVTVWDQFRRAIYTRTFIIFVAGVSGLTGNVCVYYIGNMSSEYLYIYTYISTRTSTTIDARNNSPAKRSSELTRSKFVV